MGCFLTTKENSSSTVYNPTEAFFLGGMIMCGDEHSRYDFVSLVRHNHGYANPNLLAEHRELIRVLANSVGGELTELRNRRFEGFEVHFRSSKDTDNSILERAQIAVANGTSDTWKAMLAGVFDGRASYDRKRGTQANTQFVVDCPLANEREVSELVIRLARQIGIGVNANFARERLQGGNPRKTQLRLSASEAKRFFENVGLVSPEKMQRACELYGCEKAIDRDPEQLPGIKVICSVGTPGVRSLKSAGRFSESHSARSKADVITKKATVSEPTDRFISAYPVSPARPNCLQESAKPKKHFSNDELSLIGIGVRVTHKKFGEGVIVSKDDTYLIVSLDGKDRKFAWPGSFEDGFLELM
jgi:hypothetical protein